MASQRPSFETNRVSEATFWSVWLRKLWRPLAADHGVTLICFPEYCRTLSASPA